MRRTVTPENITALPSAVRTAHGPRRPDRILVFRSQTEQKQRSTDRTWRRSSFVPTARLPCSAGAGAAYLRRAKPSGGKFSACPAQRMIQVVNSPALSEPLEPYFAGMETLLVSPIARWPNCLGRPTAGSNPDVPDRRARDRRHSGFRRCCRNSATEAGRARRGFVARGRQYRVPSDPGQSTPELLARRGARGRLRRGALKIQPTRRGERGASRRSNSRFRTKIESGSARILNHQLATEAAFREQAPHYQWLHMITHDFFAPPN